MKLNKSVSDGNRIVLQFSHLDFPKYNYVIVSERECWVDVNTMFILYEHW
jgi:hypothetical protein